LTSLSGEPYIGYAGLEQWMRDLDEQFVEWRVRIDEAREVGNAVIAFGAIHVKGRTSGVAVDQSAAGIVDFGTDQRITRARIYLDPAEALEAVGLAE
jgi:ketosteroid isomerase-like protein